MCFNIKAEAMALSFVTEDLVSLRDVLEDLLCARLLVLVRMVFERQPAVGALDLVLGGPGLQPQQLVVVLMGHGATMSEANRRQTSLISSCLVTKRKTKLQKYF